MHPESKRITLTEALALGVVLLLLIFVVLVLLPALGNGHGSPRMQSNLHLRGIHQALVVHADHHNHGYFPGLDSTGKPQQLDVEQRYKMLLDQNYLSPEYLVSPLDGQTQPWRSGALTAHHYSYAMLQVPESGGRYAEWQNTRNPRAIVLADRNTGTVARPTSVQSDRRHPGWQGGVVWNDNAVGFEQTHVYDTVYGDIENRNDHLFRAESDNDAYLIHSGN